MQVSHKPTSLNNLLAKAGRPLMPLALGLSLTIFVLALSGLNIGDVWARPLLLNHSGTINSDETWYAADNPHILTGDVIVAGGVTLTVEAGAVVQGNANTRLWVEGHLEAVGTPANPITFTSSSGAPGGWEGLYFKSTGRLRYATVRYGGAALSSNIYVWNVTDGQVIIESSQVLSVSVGYGLRAINSNVVISDTLFAGNGNSVNDYALYGAGGSSITIINSAFRDNAGYAARLEPDGPFVMAGNTFSGNGYNRVLLEGATFAGDNTLPAQTGLEGYELEADVLVPANTTLTVEPGLAVISRANTRLWVDGHLEAVGTPANPITFTSSSGAPGGWEGLYFKSTGRLRYATVRYGGAALSSNIYVWNVTDGQVIIENSQVLSVSVGYGLRAINSNVTVSDTLFAGNGNSTNDYALYGAAGSAITVTNSVFRNNAGYGIGINDSQASLACSSVAGNGNDGIYLTGSGATFWTLSSAIENNAGYGLNNMTGIPVDATYNWWGDASGPTHASNPGGTGEGVSDNVLYDPWLAFPQCVVDLLVTQTDSPDPVEVGHNITYTIVVTNNWTSIATNVTLSDTLPQNMSFFSATTSQGSCGHAGGVVTCDLGGLSSGAYAEVTIVAVTDEIGSVTNTVAVTAYETDRFPANNTVSEDSMVVYFLYVPLIINSGTE